MDNTLCQIAKQSLEDLRLHCRAENLTCHFYNSYSGLYWLFGFCGDIRYRYHMHGPLSHPDQVDRFRKGPPLVANEGIEVCFFPTVPPELSRDVLGGASFVRREGITCSVRVRMSPEVPDIGSDRTSSEEDADATDVVNALSDGVEVFIFLNFRAAKLPLSQEKLLVEHWSDLLTLRRMLIELARQPRLEGQDAWRLRSTNLHFRNILGNLKWRPSEHLDIQRRDLYGEITRCVARFIKPTSGCNTLCTLSLVDVNNRVNIVASTPQLSEEPKPGIVAYVARTGQLFFINNIEEYQNYRNSLAGANPEFLPEYVKWHPNSRCELAVPLVVQRRVVGVINLECDHAGGYDDGHVLMLYQYASTVSVIVRILALFSDLNAVLGLQQSMLAFASEREVFLSTLRALECIGYSLPAIWDDQTKEWIKLPSDSSERHPPREEGFTRWVIRSGCAVALADLLPPQDNVPVFPPSCYVGHLSNKTLDFEEWAQPRKEDVMPDGPLNPDIFRLAGPDSGIITDFAFPIFSNDTGERKVRAVVWAKCRRFFRAVLTDEWCCVALFCKSASEALRVWRSLYSKRAPARQMVLDYHFGERRGGQIAELLEVNPRALEARLAKDIICLNLDIRGSSEFTRKLAQQRRSDAFVNFFRDFHEMTHQAVLSSAGAFDKHMGDGAQALFNIFRNDVLTGYAWPLSDRTSEMQGALNCVRLVFENWNELVLRHQRLLPIDPAHDFSLGAGLSIGEAFVGGLFSPQQVPGFEFSAHGDQINTAAKLQTMARAKELRELLQTAYKRDANSVLAYPQKTSITPSELNDLDRKLQERWRCILLMSTDFESAIQDASQGFRLYRIPLEGPGNALWILGLLDNSR